MPKDAAEAIRNAHEWFESNSGWAPPDEDGLAEWVADGVCRCPDDCIADPEGWCSHGLASWWLILGALEERPWAESRPPPRDPRQDGQALASSFGPARRTEPLQAR